MPNLVSCPSSHVRLYAYSTADVMHAAESPQLTTALKAFATLTREQKAALSRTVDGFVDYLVAADKSNQKAGEVITEKEWHNRVNWNEEQWETWETWCWFRHFCRAVSTSGRQGTLGILTCEFCCSIRHISATTRSHWRWLRCQKSRRLVRQWTSSRRHGTSPLGKTCRAFVM